MGRWEQFSPKYVCQCFWTNVDVDETLAYVHECQFLLLTVCKRQIKGQTSTSIPQKKPMCLCISYLISYLYNCLAHILLSSEYTLERILIAQESFKIIHIMHMFQRPSGNLSLQKSLEVAHQWASWLLVFLWLLVFNIQYIGQAVQEHIRCKNMWVPSDSKHNTIVIYNPSRRTAGVDLEIIATLSWKLLKSKTLASSNLDNVATML